jgi:hypothetical protein
MIKVFYVKPEQYEATRMLMMRSDLAELIKIFQAGGYELVAEIDGEDL